MNPTLIKTDEHMMRILNDYANIVQTKEGNAYYHIPFWFKATDKPDVFEVHSLENIPDDLRGALERNRKAKQEMDDAKKKKYPLTPDECTKCGN